MPPSAGPAERVVLDSLRVRVWAAADERRLLVHWWRHDPPGPTGQACWDHVRVLALGRAALAAGDAGAAREVVAPAIAAARTGEPDLAFVPALILDGIAAYTSGAGDGTAALDRTMEALLLTAADGRLAPWLAMGQAATPLLEAVVKEWRRLGPRTRPHVDSARPLTGGPPRHAGPGPGRALGRELTVLRLLAAGHTNQEIADTLFLALGSVKKHTHNIYGKLGVKSRTQAVRAARERRMLD